MHRAGPTARTLDERVAQLEGELRRVERERDILKKALAILSQHAYLAYFNQQRRHSSLDYLPPAAFEDLLPVVN